VLTVADRDAESRASVLQHLPEQNPSVIHADTDGDRSLDYALPLKSDQSQIAKLVIPILLAGELV
jgi:hypothetical protein